MNLSARACWELKGESLSANVSVDTVIKVAIVY